MKLTREGNYSLLEFRIQNRNNTKSFREKEKKTKTDLESEIEYLQAANKNFLSEIIRLRSTSTYQVNLIIYLVYK